MIHFNARDVYKIELKLFDDIMSDYTSILLLNYIRINFIALIHVSLFSSIFGQYLAL